MGQPLLPDVPNWSWHEYGMPPVSGGSSGANRPQHAGNAGAERQRLQLLPARGVSRTRCRLEFMGHGFVQGPMHKLDNQADAIKRAVDTIAKFTGKPPRSWESPGLTETEETIDLLRLNGIEYLPDW